MGWYTELLFKPLFNALVFLYNALPAHDLGLAIIVLTLVIRVILYPLNRKAIISQKAIQVIQPQIEELKEKYKDNREKLSAAMMELYKKEKVNPFSSCLPILVQLPVLIAVYQVFQSGIASQSFNLLYPGVANPGTLNTIAFGFLDLAKRSIPLAILAGLAQFWQSKMLMQKRTGKATAASAMNAQMLYMMPAVTILIGSSFPAGLTLYWFSTTLFSGLQQLWTFKKKKSETASAR